MDTVTGMRILLTGGTGYIGSAVLEALVSAGHTVTAVARSRKSAERVAARGASALIGDVTDVAWFSAVLADADAAIHAASPDEGAPAWNDAIVEAGIRAYGGSHRRFVLTSGIWEYGPGDRLADDDPVAPPELVAWRVPQEDRLLASGVDAVIVAPGVVYGHERGLVRGLIQDAPRTESGALRLIGDGEQHWTLVHVDDLARLYVAAVTHEGPLGRVIGSDGSPTSVREIAEAVAGTAGVEPEAAEATRARLGVAFADALLLDQAADGAKARSLGWMPEHTNVLDELREARAAA
jgi:nucleoside-diphosphate-sugar epimerase